MSLARPGDPYITPKGNVVKTSSEISKSGVTSSVMPGEEYTIGSPVARRIIPTHRKSVSELPGNVQTQKGVAVVLMYSMLGVSDNEMAQVLGVDMETIERMKHLTEYQEIFDLLFGEMISTQSQSLQARIASFAPKALDNLITLANEAENERVKLLSNADLLDRAGLHHEALHGKRHTDNAFDSLNIVIHDGSDDGSKKVEVNINGNSKR